MALKALAECQVKYLPEYYVHGKVFHSEEQKHAMSPIDTP